MVYRPNSVVSIECCRELPAAGSADTGHSRNSWVVSVSQSAWSQVHSPLSRRLLVMPMMTVMTMMIVMTVTACQDHSMNQLPGSNVTTPASGK